ncbi:glycosyltransferase family 2 protein [Aureimonas phyllosphaerae]|uniref:Cellulose synthase/poly-beta-1,6-N-acetylglucosamine synthase-like glycosyltransferase n=1 Tax=Aureimonas phyllosphaerae TaxID=1166078 RepID=A0A7W6BVP8_9HYPH|nr:glycosyltransferase family 2 protein [Aureimonas phyllosphaerae]MBB3935953.1 cellulose synthase/poly-beta-1,6-N-acetylglucosamine synthase-like glycosyltransferase [Aureimonas phyllosphaerae]MBB3960322.1 cellulose synthase/poly-beta-1,6-N-acetylglucosamine synthase-like glycosyltransferase [Aureimonas phyllosphaerae]SFF36398.1 Glycosyltransferase, catalytic subunit of cellulose synthase and poly-beta-1,6-N-acetylglucosamine synthase [Aureimonas phyllosphaerae]
MRVSEYALADEDASGLGLVSAPALAADALAFADAGLPTLPPVVAEALARLGLDAERFDAACRLAERNGSSADEELIAAGVIDEATLARTLAAVLGLRFEPIRDDASLLRDGRGAFDASERHAKTCDTAMRPRLYLAPRLDRLEGLARRVARAPELATTLRIATLSDIAAKRGAASASERSTRARLSLAADHNRWSARDVLTPAQAAVAVLVLVALAHAWFAAPGPFWFAAHATASLCALCFTLFRLRVLVGTALAARPRPALPANRRTVAPAPIYSVLVALHREAAMAEPLARAMAALDWPRSRLEVFFVCEANDPETIMAVERAIAGEANFSVIATPRTNPTTKPKALNFALPLTRGDYVVLFDAEDRPDPGQLRAAHAAFEASSASLACVQAPLVIRNAANGWLETLFALEYAVLFRAILPWLARRGLPLPLGGTSNHFRRAALVEAGGWDSHNVAEDADLGIRLSRLGYRIGTIASPTSEIAPSRFLDWRNQRTRWIKGWCQTWLVHMRDPRLACRQLGPRAFLTFQILFGGMIAASLMHVMFAGHLLAAAYAYLVHGEIYLSAGVLAAVDALNIALAYAVFILTARLVANEAERPLLPRLWSLWFYWLIVSLAGLRAIGQLFHSPHMWEKTPHREPASGS